MSASSSTNSRVLLDGRRARRHWRRAGGSANLFSIPAILLLVVFVAYPLINGFNLSLQNWDGFSTTPSFVGLANYFRLFGDQVFGTALFNTFVYGIGITVIQQILGISLAVALDSKLRGRNVFRAIIYLPVMVSPAIMATMYYLLFEYHVGSLNDFVGLFGIPPQAWLSNSTTALLTVVLVSSVQGVGITMIIYLAGLQSIPPMYHEAAMLDGAGGWQRFWNVTLPLLQPAFATSAVLNLIGGLKLFDMVQVLTGGGPGYATQSVSTLIGKTYFDNQMAGYSSAMGVVLFLIIVVFSLGLNAVLNRRRLEDEI